MSKSVRYGLEKKNEEPVNRCGTMKNPPSAAKQQIAEMVEVRGVEPLSESTSVRLSPGAGHSLSFPPLQVKGQTCRFSSFIVHGARKA